MKTSDVVMLAAVGVAGALALGSIRKVQGATVDPSNLQGVSTAGLPGFVAAHGTQSQLTDAAIQQNWADLSASLDKSQPDWWI